MMDRECVISALACCNERGMCRACPYYDDGGVIQCIVHMTGDALKLLKGEPAEPIWHEEIRMWECAACGGPIRGSDKFCPECGRKQTWGA